MTGPGLRLNLDLKSGTPLSKSHAKRFCLSRYENQLVMTPGISITEGQPCPTLVSEPDPRDYSPTSSDCHHPGGNYFFCHSPPVRQLQQKLFLMSLAKMQPA